jgi:hypothetical protein
LCVKYNKNKNCWIKKIILYLSVIYNIGYCEKTIGVVWFVSVLLDGGIGSICSWEGSTWPIAELNDSIVVIRDKVKKTSTISSIGK